MDREKLLSSLKASINLEHIRMMHESDPIREAYEKRKPAISWEEYLKNRNESARKLGFKDAYDESYHNRNECFAKSNDEKDQTEK